MATIRKEIALDASHDDVWDALRDFHAVHERLVPGFVVDSQPDGDTARIVTFFNGAVAREVLVGDRRDGAPARLPHPRGATRAARTTAPPPRCSPDGPGCRFVWVTDVLPDELADAIEPMMEHRRRCHQDNAGGDRSHD